MDINIGLQRKHFNDSAKLICLGLLLTCVLAALYFASDVTMATIMGIGLGVIVSPLMALLKFRFGIPRSVSAVILFFFLFGGAIGLGYAVYILAADQATALAERAPDLFNTIRAYALGVIREQPWIRQQIEGLDMAGATQKIFEKLFSGVGTGFSAISGAAIVFLLALYVAINANEYFRGLISAFPAHARSKAELVFTECAVSIRKWFRGQATVMLITGTLTTIGLWILGVDYWLVFGLLTIVLGIIPYIGILIAVSLTGLVTLASAPDKVIWVLGLFFLLQQIEGNFILPKVMKDQADMPEAHMIVVMLFLGTWFGILGVFLAPPLFAVGLTVFRLVYVQKMDTLTSSP
jgi:predicted PurR-regulated permease PerM